MYQNYNPLPKANSSKAYFWIYIANLNHTLHQIRCVAVALAVVLISCPSLTLASDTAIQSQDGVVRPHPAPAWDISEWLNANPGNIAANRKKVIVIDFFQLWCPGCNTFSGPLMQKWQERFSDEIASEDLLLIKVHTVFEGHNYQTVRRLKKYLDEKGITMPVGVDRHLGNDYLPETKKRYRTRGTPEIVMIDREGMIRFKQFGWFDPAKAEAYLEYLLGGEVSPKRRKPVEVCLASDLCG